MLQCTEARLTKSQRRSRQRHFATNNNEGTGAEKTRHDDHKMQISGWATRVLVCVVSLAWVIAIVMPLAAQVRDQHEDANAARHDAMFGTPNVLSLSPQTNLFSTSPGLEQQARRSRFTVNGLVPIFFNSNAEARPVGGTNSAEFSPLLGASWSTPAFDLPLRFTANARAEVDRLTAVPSADFDKIALSGRLQHIDPNNDQAYSPYISYAPRWDFDPFYKGWFATRQDVNAGVNKTFNFDADFKRVAFAGDTFSETKWAVGVTAAIQRRFRDPARGSWAAFFVPSMTYVISSHWNISGGIDMERRAFDPASGFSREDWFIEPIVTLEYVLPSSWFGSATNAAIVGRPALDFQVAYEKNWSNLPDANYEIWYIGAALKLGWRF
jgi:hypothetical protein